MKEKLKNRLIFLLALLTIYFILTAAVAVIFEYYTVSVSKGEIIFSIIMSWQMILLIVELITIVVQAVSVIRLINNNTHAAYMGVKVGGIIAGTAGGITAIGLIAYEGFVVFPTLVFVIYALLIIVVRGIVFTDVANKYQKV